MAEGSGRDELDDDLQLSELRSVFRSMRDEEPSERGLDALLAAAREKAAEMAPREAPEPCWRRALASLRRPPALALASVAVLLGGALVVARHRDELVDAPPASAPDVARAERQVAAESAPPASSSTPVAASRGPAEIASGTPALATGAGTAPGAALGAAPAGTVETDAKVGQRVAVEAEPRRRGPVREETKEPKAKRPSRRAVEPVRTASQTAAAEREAPGSYAAPRPSATATAGAGRAQSLADTSAAEDASSATSNQASNEASNEASTEAPAQAPVDALIRRCLAVAAKGDCAAVRALAAQIAKLDPAAYRSRVATNAAVKRCLSVATDGAGGE